MSYIRLIRLYWRTGRAWGYRPYETIIEICFALFSHIMKYDS